MMRAAVVVDLALIVHGAAFGQPAVPAPKFEIADVHVTAKTTSPNAKTEALRGQRYEIHAATMLDLIDSAWGFDPGKIVGGPSWLETDRFDVTAKVPENTAPETLQAMLQVLLADRFSLVVHKDLRPVPAWTLAAGKKPMLKPADGSGDGNCSMQPKMPEGGGLVRFLFSCRNMTMADFAAGLGTMRGVDIRREAVLDRTGLKGAWNFDVAWSPIGAPAFPGAEPPITAFDALDKQLGLKLEKQPVPALVMVVDSLNEKPANNPPGVAEALPAIPLATAFDVADVKMSAPDSRGTPLALQPGGRVVIHGETMSMLINRALQPDASRQIVSIPGWAATDRFDIIAKAPESTVLSPDTLAPMFRTLLEDRFKLATHTEERPVSTYSLEAAKPKLTKADPANRAGCSRVPGPPGTPAARPLVIECRNTTMAQFAAQLPGLSARYVSVPVVDTTGLDGAWDFTFSFSTLVAQTGGRGGPAEPDGTVTFSEALEKQLGLKLKEEKRSMPVTVIDHLEEKPTDN